MRKIFKKIIVLFLHYSGLNWLLRYFLSKRVFCIGYHSVWSEKSKEEFSQKLYWNISVSSGDFEKQIIFLKNNGHSFIHFSDLKNSNVRNKRKPTVIFFDDGFRDVIENVLPILKKYNIPATIFITTGLIDRTHFLWTIAVRYFLYKQGTGPSEIESKIKELKKLAISEREEKISKMFKGGNFVSNPGDFNVFLSWPEIKMLSENNFEIGSHATSHQKLTELSEEELKTELWDSKKTLKEKTGKSIEIISYPYGRHNTKVIEEAQKAGYTLGLSTLAGSNSFDYIAKNPFKIKRINPEEDKALMDFKVRLYTGI